MTDKPDLTLIDMEPLDQLPKEAYSDFKNLVLDNSFKPSKALYSIMDKYNCDNVHVLSVVHLLEYAYPELDINLQGFKSRLIDAAYPENQNRFSDDDFDAGIAELLSLPPRKAW